MEGQEAEEVEQKLVVVPHYPLWDPGDQRTPNEAGGLDGDVAKLLQFPYQSRRETLSREAWIDAYKSAAPRIQRMLDLSSESIKDWGPKADKFDCTNDVAGFISKAKNERAECIKHQEIINVLAPHSPFESSVPDGKGGFIPVNCVMGGQGMCESLNCYSSDVDVIKGLDQLNERYKTCRKALKLLVEEEVHNGPIEGAAEVSAQTGGRLEVALPPPSEGHQFAMPVDVAFAVWSAAGVASSLRANFAADSRPTSRGEFRSGMAGVRKSLQGRLGASAAMAFSEFLYTCPGHSVVKEVACA
jgi:hypothetical protein